MRCLAAGVVLLVAVVSGCSAGEAAPAEVRPLASGSASAGAVASAGGSASPEVSSSPHAAPPLPSEAQAPNAAGASAFARHYFEVMDGALRSGQSEQLDALSDAGCGGCRNVLTAIADADAAGRRVREAQLQVEFAEAPAVVGGETIVDLRYTRAAGEVVDERGITVDNVPSEGPIDAQLRLRYATGTWSVLGFRQVPA